MMRGPLVPAKGLVRIVDLGGERTFAVRVMDVRFRTNRAWPRQLTGSKTGSRCSALATRIEGHQVNQHTALSPAPNSLFCCNGL